MADGPNAGNGDSTDSIWRGLKGLIFGAPDESLRDQLEEVISAHDEEDARPIAGDLAPIERQMLRNLLHFLGLRAHSHAQVEAQAYANAIIGLLTPHIPGLMALWKELRK